MMKETAKRWMKDVDPKILIFSGAICLVFVIWTAVAPDTAAVIFSGCLSFLTTDFGWLYLLVVNGFVIFLLALAFSRYGRIRLGDEDDRPDYSTFAWFFMLFAAGMGIGLVFWSVAEPMSHYLTPPYGEGSTVESAELAMRYSFMHWGMHPWACYGIIGLPLAYYQFRKHKPALVSTCTASVIGEKAAKGTWGRVIDVLTLLTAVFGISTSLGLGAGQINSGLYYVFGIPVNNTAILVIIAVTTALFICSAVSGIKRGVRFLSDFNMALVAVLLLFVFIAGPTLFQMNFFTDSLGGYFQNIISTSFWTDPFDVSGGWLGSWTVFYWGWWIAWAAPAGAFIARISKGRTIREFVLGTLLCPILVCFAFMTVMGGTAIYFDMNGITNVASAMDESSFYALFALLQDLPATKLFSILSIVLIVIFFVTSADSSTFVCAMMTSHGVQEPHWSIKIFWGLLMAAVAAVLWVSGGLGALQTVSIAAAFPFMIVCIIVAASFIKDLRHEKVDFVGEMVIPSEDEEQAVLRTGPSPVIRRMVLMADDEEPAHAMYGGGTASVAEGGGSVRMSDARVMDRDAEGGGETCVDEGGITEGS